MKLIVPSNRSIPSMTTCAPLAPVCVMSSSSTDQSRLKSVTAKSVEPIRNLPDRPWTKVLAMDQCLVESSGRASDGLSELEGSNMSKADSRRRRASGDDQVDRDIVAAWVNFDVL